MLYVEDNQTVKLTRGDTAYLSVSITNPCSETGYYVMSENDTLTLSVKKNVKDDSYIFTKSITGSNEFHIEPEDTADSAFGKFVYDVQLTTESGDIYTIIEPHTFEIMSEVTV